MNPLVPAFIAALLAAWGEKTQLIVAQLSARTGRPGRVVFGLFLATLVSSAVAGWAGAFSVLAIGPILGCLAMARLRREPDAARIAGGRR